MQVRARKRLLIASCSFGRAPAQSSATLTERTGQRSRSCLIQAIWKRFPYPWREPPQSGCRSPQGRSSLLVEPLQTIAGAKASHVLHRVHRLRALLANSDEFLHRLGLFIPFAEITLTDRFPHELRHGGLSAARASVKRMPEIVV